MDGSRLWMCMRTHTPPIHPLRGWRKMHTARSRDDKVLAGIDGGGDGSDLILVTLKGGTQNDLNVAGSLHNDT